MLLKRFFNSFLILALAFLIIFHFPNWVFTCLAAALIGLALHEYFAMTDKKGIFVYKYFAISIGMLVPVIIYFQRGIAGYTDLDPFFIVIACLFAFVLQFTRRDNSQALVSIAVTMMGLLYISWFFSFFVKLKFLPHGEWLVTYLILTTKASDIGAYCVGTALGRHPLIPRISPAKTVEGTIGGLLSSLAVSLLFFAILPNGIPVWHLAVLGIMLGILSQVGDLAESVIKRDCRVKDSGKDLSGFGGILDLLDSLMFTTPIFYYYALIVLRTA